jgi:hypothetical protein
MCRDRRFSAFQQAQTEFVGDLAQFGTPGVKPGYTEPKNKKATPKNGLTV